MWWLAYLAESMQGRPNRVKVRRFVAQLEKQLVVPVVFEDERHTSIEFSHVPKKERDAKGIDALSALSICRVI